MYAAVLSFVCPYTDITHKGTATRAYRTFTAVDIADVAILSNHLCLDITFKKIGNGKVYGDR
jgi:hypothetical protein